MDWSKRNSLVYFLIISLFFYFGCVSHNPTFYTRGNKGADINQNPDAYSEMRTVKSAPQKRGYDVSKGPKTKTVKTNSGNPSPMNKELKSAKKQRGYDVTEGPKLKIARASGAPGPMDKEFRAAKKKRGYDVTEGPKISFVKPAVDYVGPMDREIVPPKKRQRNEIFIQKPMDVKKPKVCKAHKKQKHKPKYENDQDIWN